MIDARALPQRVRWIEPTEGPDEYENTVWQFDPDDPGVELAVRIDQDSTTRQRDGRDTITDHAVLITNELAVTARARFIDDDKVYEAAGEPFIAHTSSGPHHLEVPITRVEG